MSVADTLIVGVTRCSVVNKSTLTAFFETKEVDVEAARARIYEAERLRHRFALLETIMLPSVRVLAERHKSFCQLLLVSDDLPKMWKNRLASLAERIPWLTVAEVGADETVSTATRRAISQWANGGRVFSFRIDDDDAVSTQYTDELLARLPGVPDGSALSFDTGVFVEGCDATSAYVAPKSVPCIALGLGYVTRAPDQTVVFGLGRHTTIAERFPTVNVTGGTYWLRSLHAHNDTGPRRAPTSDAQTINVMREALQPLFPYVDFAALAPLLAET
jgi:hypothetical protein